MLLRLFVKLPISSISFPVLSCYGLVDMPVNLGAFFVVILSYLVFDRRELLLSEHKLENMFSFTCLTLVQLGNFPGRGFLEFIYQHMKVRPLMVKFWSFFFDVLSKQDFK